MEIGIAGNIVSGISSGGVNVSTSSNRQTGSRLSSNDNAPLIQVDESGQISSPFAQIQQQNNAIADIANTPLTSPEARSTTQQQVAEVSGAIRNVQSRQQELAKEEQDINREIQQLQQQEIELNQRRFRLQQESSLGNLVNLQI